MPIKQGATVKQKVPAIEGVVDQRRFDESSGEMEYHVAYAGPDGASARWFKESELAVLKEPQPEEAAPAPTAQASRAAKR